MSGLPDATTHRLRAAAVLSPLAGLAGWLALGRPVLGAALSAGVVVLCFVVPAKGAD